MRPSRGLLLALVVSASAAVSIPLGALLGPWPGGILSGVLCGAAVLAYRIGPAEFLAWVWLEIRHLPDALTCLWWDYLTPTGRPDPDEGAPILAPLTGYDLQLLQRYAEGRATGQPEVHPSTTAPTAPKEN